jgi:hypothetical protein
MNHSMVHRADPSPLTALLLGCRGAGGGVSDVLEPCDLGGSTPIIDRVIHSMALTP